MYSTELIVTKRANDRSIEIGYEYINVQNKRDVWPKMCKTRATLFVIKLTQ